MPATTKGKVDFLHRRSLGHRAWHEFRFGLDLAGRRVPGARDGLHVYVQRGYYSSRRVTAYSRLAMNSGVPSVFFRRDLDPAEMRWPRVDLAAVFDHDHLDDTQLQALVEALHGAGVDQVFLAATRWRRTPTLARRL
jgi:hypothetical protein